MKLDELGPEAVIQVHEPRTGMRGVLVIDNSVCGPCGGGARMAADLTVQEVMDLARGMTYKFAIMGIPRGGSKAGIFSDPGPNRLEPSRKRDILREFGRALAPLLSSRDVAIGPDMGVSIDDVGTIYEGAGCPNVRSGLYSVVIEGDPAAYHFTGFGVATAIDAALKGIDRSVEGASIAIEGFGQVGVGTARYIDRWGARVVAITTLCGGIYDPEGLDIGQLLELRRAHGDACVLEYQGNAKPLAPKDLYYLPVDVVVPGARPYVIDLYNAAQIKAKVLCAAANIAVTEAAEEALFRRGVVCLPDFVTNSGGALASWVDILKGTPEQAKEVVGRMIGRVTAEVLAESRDRGRNPCEVARLKVWEKLTTSERQRLSFEETRVLIREHLGL